MSRKRASDPRVMFCLFNNDVYRKRSSFCSRLRSFRWRSGGVVLLLSVPWSFRNFYVSLRRLRQSPTRKQL